MRPSQSPTLSPLPTSALLCLALGTLPLSALSSSCSEDALRQPPPPPVVVAEPLVRDVEDAEIVTGTTEPFETVEVRARVQGTLLAIVHQEGLPVTTGQRMFEIDPAPFTAARDAAQAEVRGAEAEAELADITATKLEQAYEDRAVSELQALEARARHAVAVQQVEIARKNLAIRDLDLSYTRIDAPISGKAAKSGFDVGSLVGGLGSGALTRIVDETRIRAWFTMPDRVLLRFLAEQGSSDKRLGDLSSLPPVKMARELDDDFPFEGRIDYVDPEVDPDTGTLRMRAVFDNPDGQLLGGLFARIRIPVGQLPQAVIVPEAALGSDQRGRFVYVVGEGNLVQRRELTLGPRTEDGIVVLEGVKAGERVIVAGQLSARPGAPVTPRPQDPAPDAASGADRD